mmetsp:Transcript_17927/g.38155  ORF Transcript_17927/g.38155 Transcript_17927/m.38155 type:complete len:385 (-) Transcript_17927:62-1216(-)
MVVSYPSGSGVSVFSFLTITPRVIFWRVGSVLPGLLPQLAISVTVSCVAVHLEKTGNNPVEDLDDKGFNSLAFLLAFLVVFKTQNAFTQYWTALSHVDGMLQVSRGIATIACTVFDWEHDPEIKDMARRILRYVVVHYFVIIEYFQRSGANASMDPKVHDSLRSHIRHLTGENEYDLLYPEENRESGSQSSLPHTNPSLVVYWIMLALGRVLRKGGVPPPIAGGFIAQVQTLTAHFWGMDKIDKVQFPLPYAQIVKILVTLYVFASPLFLVKGTREFTPLIAVLQTIGFFGLDEVAEILESPFGNDANDIDLKDHGQALMEDLELMYYGREQQLDTVFTNDRDLNFQELILQSGRSENDGHYSAFFKSFPSRQSLTTWKKVVPA